MGLQWDFSGALPFVDAAALKQWQQQGAEVCHRLLHDMNDDPGVKGWLDCAAAAGSLEEIEALARRIRAEADTFVLVGVGGSNQAARAVIKALAPAACPRIVYMGNTLSAPAIRAALTKLDGKHIFLNVIAKNFETLEPGSHYRLLRSALGKHCTPAELAHRTVLTGTPGSRLHAIAQENGCAFLPFPEAVGGRYSAFTPVALLPLAVAGVDIHAYLRGGRDMAAMLAACEPHSPAVAYAALRRALLENGFGVEVLASFEPQLSWLGRWWWQLFGESEGKNGTGLFPATAIYSEDLHSIGQYIQEGRRFLAETFLCVTDPQAAVPVPPDPTFGDGFDYLDGMDFAGINRVAQEATVAAHIQGGVPCTRITADRLDAYHFGQLFYFFMTACAVSGKLLGVNPFDQNGVEAYKKSMFRTLGR